MTKRPLLNVALALAIILGLGRSICFAIAPTTAPATTKPTTMPTPPLTAEQKAVVEQTHAKLPNTKRWAVACNTARLCPANRF